MGRRKWQPTPVFLPGESHGQRSLEGYSLRGHKESDTTVRLHSLAHTSFKIITKIMRVLFPKERMHTIEDACVYAIISVMKCNLINCSLLGSSVHKILQARILEWVAMPFSKNRG